MRQIPAGASTISQSVIPPDVRKRYGLTEDLHQELYDTLLYGRGQTLRDEELVFGGSPGKKDIQLTNVSAQGYLLNERQFLICGMWAHTYFDQSTALPEGAPNVTRLYYLYNTYTYYTFFLGSNEKQLIWSHRVPSGGGISGFNQNNNSVTYTNGMSHAKNAYWFKEPHFVGLRQTFEMKLRWMNRLATGAGVYPGAFNPLDDFNSNTTAEKLLRVGLIGIEGRGWTNG